MVWCDWVKDFYLNELINETRLSSAVEKNLITEEEKIEIINSKK